MIIYPLIFSIINYILNHLTNKLKKMFQEDDDDDDFTSRLNAGLDYNRPGYSQTSYVRGGR